MIGPGDPCPPATQPSQWMVGGPLCQLPPPHYSPGLFRKLLDRGSLCVEGQDGQKAGNAPGTAHCQSLEEAIDPDLSGALHPVQSLPSARSTEHRNTGLTQKKIPVEVSRRVLCPGREQK